MSVSDNPVGPISPAEIEQRKIIFPKEVFETFNRLIADNWNGHSATVMQKEATKAIADVLNIPVSQIFNKGYLDIEEAYRAAGWHVQYDKPAFDESYEPHFVFKKP